MKRSLVAVVAALLALPAVSSAKDFEHAEARLGIWIPDDWHTETEDAVLAARDPAEEVGVLFVVLDAADVEKAAEELGTVLDEIVTEVEPIGEPTDGKVNGMDARFLDGKGEAGGREVRFSLGLVVTPAGKVTMMLGIAETAKFGPHEADVGRILRGVKPLQQAAPRGLAPAGGRLRHSGRVGVSTVSSSASGHSSSSENGSGLS